MSTGTNPVVEEADDSHDVVFSNQYGLRVVELNRPAKLNALNGSMIRKILPRLVEWEKSDMANVIVMKGAGRAFCAGGDVAQLATQNQEGPAGQKRSADYFGLEYKLDHYIATYRKPYIAFMDGFTMGGGVGLSIHAPFRIATERSVFAMPETTIGFFPDVGASFFLPRMAGSIGTYLALTSERLKGANVFYSGIATHYLHSTSLPSLEARLAELRFKDYYTIEERLAVIEMTIEEYATGLPHNEPMVLAGELRNAIDRCFGQATVPEIIAALQQEQGPTQAWAEKTLATLHQRSPTSVHVALRQMQIGKTWSIAETFRKEHQVAAKFMQHHDFVEGVTARLISKEDPKPTPQWQPASLEAIPPSQDVAGPFFEESDDVPALQLMNDLDYTQYPYSAFGVPTENDVRDSVLGVARTRQQIRDDFVAQKKGRQGIGMIVDEILARKTRVDSFGKAVWLHEE
ncbi:3-hydroxyisobutyryl-CoA hydrolase [Diatrype stigma]|uniref:3-hydroxyisobutyryl-CoA hydrolase n=1 Tax=Diatrype stigma TaxID=117547 RepID=A0AAN9USW2_9PEZI